MTQKTMLRGSVWLGSAFGAILAALILIPLAANAIFAGSPPRIIQQNDITSNTILDDTILDVDMSSTTLFSLDELTLGSSTDESSVLTVVASGTAADVIKVMSSTTAALLNLQMLEDGTPLFGVGTSSPSAALSITSLGTYALWIEDESTDTSPFIINGNGNVGIGTTTTSQKLNIEGSNAYISLNDSSNGSEVLFGADLNRLQLWVGGTEWVSLTSAGNFGIGTTSPEVKFSMPGNAAIDGTLRLNKVTYTFPSADGTDTQFLQTNGAGTLSWAAADNLLGRKASTTSMVSQAATTTLLTVNVPGGKLGTNRAIKITYFGETDANVQATDTFTYNVIYGGQTVAFCTLPTTDTTPTGHPVTFEAYIFANGATNAQFSSSYCKTRADDVTFEIVESISNISTSVDSSVNQDLSIGAFVDINHVNAEHRNHYIVVESI